MLVATRGLGHNGGFKSTSGLGRGGFVEEAKRVLRATHDKFNDLIDQIKEEDELLLAVCQSLVKTIWR